MNADFPRYLLLTDGIEHAEGRCEWRFVLSNQATGEVLSANDREPEVESDRLALLALVRGLEALAQPARVTLITPSRYVRHGVERGLRDWKANGWKWERFGRLVTVRDHDLWRRVDEALQIHQVECRSWRLSVTDHTECEPTIQPPTAAARIAEKPLPATQANPTPVFDPRSATDSQPAFFQEPALLVVRKPRNRLRIDQPHQTINPRRQYAHASAG